MEGCTPTAADGLSGLLGLGRHSPTALVSSPAPPPRASLDSTCGGCAAPRNPALVWPTGAVLGGWGEGGAHEPGCYPPPPGCSYPQSTRPPPPEKTTRAATLCGLPKPCSARLPPGGGAHYLVADRCAPARQPAQRGCPPCPRRGRRRCLRRRCCRCRCPLRPHHPCFFHHPVGASSGPPSPPPPPLRAWQSPLLPQALADGECSARWPTGGWAD